MLYTSKSLWAGFVGLRSGPWATSGMRYHLGGMQISENYVILRNAWDQLLKFRIMRTKLFDVLTEIL